MNFLLFIEVSMSDNDRKLLIVLMVILVLLFILLGLIGMLIRFTMQQQGKRIDTYMHDPVVYRVVADPQHFRKYGYQVNNRLLYHQALVPFILGGVSLVFYLIYAGVTGAWGEDYFGHCSSLFFTWKWNDPAIYANFWGLTLLTRWPDLQSAPAPRAEYWASYVLVPLLLTTIVYFLVVIQAYFARFLMINRRSRTIYEKSLEGYNFYSTMGGNAPAQPVSNPTATAPVPPSNSSIPPR
jgi:hypothetical protein